MSEWKFSRDDVSALMYLIDQIIKDDFHKTNENIYKKIVAEGAKSDEEIHNRTIRRAFDFTKQLKGEIPPSKKISKPSLPTLNCITNYYFEGNPDIFLDFVKHHATDIKNYAETSGPTAEVLNHVFEEAPPKVAVHQNYILVLESLLEELKNTSLEAFVKGITEERLANAITNASSEKVRIGLENFIEERITASEKKMKRVSLIYRFLGGFGLFFVTTPQFSNAKAYVIDAFVDDYEDDFDITDEDDNDLDDELLDAAL